MQPPVDPFQGFTRDLTDGLLGGEELDHLGREHADDAFGQSAAAEPPTLPTEESIPESAAV